MGKRVGGAEGPCGLIEGGSYLLVSGAPREGGAVVGLDLHGAQVVLEEQVGAAVGAGLVGKVARGKVEVDPGRGGELRARTEVG